MYTGSNNLREHLRVSHNFSLMISFRAFGCTHLVLSLTLLACVLVMAISILPRQCGRGWKCLSLRLREQLKGYRTLVRHPLCAHGLYYQINLPDRYYQSITEHIQNELDPYIKGPEMQFAIVQPSISGKAMKAYQS